MHPYDSIFSAKFGLAGLHWTCQVSELIHKSEAYMNLPSCKVSVHFVEIKDKDENGEDYDIVEGSELEVSRAAFSDNTNKYYINGRGSNYKEVTDLLKKAGIDLDHNRFLILQGEVELISLMPPKARNENETGMLEYLEDIIGSNKLVEQIEVPLLPCPRPTFYPPLSLLPPPSSFPLSCLWSLKTKPFAHWPSDKVHGRYTSFRCPSSKGLMHHQQE